MNRKTFNAALLAALLGASMTAAAQPSGQPIKLIVGFPPGGSTDTIARVLADKLAVVLKQPVIVDNKPGAGGRLGSQALKTSAPDGLTYMVAPNAAPVFQALMYPVETLKFDMLKDFAPVAVLVSYPLALAVSKETGVKTIKDFIAWAKANPTKANFGTAGAGGQTHFTGLQLGKTIGVPLQVVPYKGNGPLITDLLGGQVASGVLVAGDILPHQVSGKVNVVGVFGAKRSPLMPDVPTFKEQGVDIDTGDPWAGMWAPAQTPPVELERMQNALRQVLALPEVIDVLGKATLTPDFRPAAEMDRLQRKDLAYWGPIIKASGFTPDQ
jgi:tripartite-type tricarboxylate transporter receptor subunit TctC